MPPKRCCNTYLPLKPEKFTRIVAWSQGGELRSATANFSNLIVRHIFLTRDGRRRTDGQQISFPPLEKGDRRGICLSGGEILCVAASRLIASLEQRERKNLPWPLFTKEGKKVNTELIEVEEHLC
jgi:hypothetical protein